MMGLLPLKGRNTGTHSLCQVRIQREYSICFVYQKEQLLANMESANTFVSNL